MYLTILPLIDTRVRDFSYWKQGCKNYLYRDIDGNIDDIDVGMDDIYLWILCKYSVV